MELSTFKASENTVKLQLLHPGTNEAIEGSFITVHGKDSTQAQKYQKRLTQDRLKKKNLKMTAEDIESATIGLLAACTQGWEGIELEGKPYEFSHENAMGLYRDWPWIREQVSEAIEDRERFFTNSPKSSTKA